MFCTPTNLLSFLLGALGTLDSKMLGSARRQQCVTYRITLVLVLPIARNAVREHYPIVRPGVQALVVHLCILLSTYTTVYKKRAALL